MLTITRCFVWYVASGIIFDKCLFTICLTFTFSIFWYSFFNIQDLYPVSYDFLLWLITMFYCAVSLVFRLNPSFHSFLFHSFFLFCLAISWFLHHSFLTYAHPLITLFSFPFLSIFESPPCSSCPDWPHRLHRIHRYPSMLLITPFPPPDILISWFPLTSNNILSK